MRILWNEQEHWFQAELGLGEFWRDDMELVKHVGFKTTGSPGWIWHTSKASILNKLRDAKPKSGLSITELALEKYKSLNEQETKQSDLKKEFLKQRKQAAENRPSNWKEYLDEDTGIMCKVVPPAEQKFVWKYVPPPVPDLSCFMCGSPLYMYDLPDICIWCDKIKLDKNPVRV
jgi:hypothetical protein